MQISESWLIIAVVVIGLIILAGGLFAYVVYRSAKRPPQQPKIGGSSGSSAAPTVPIPRRSVPRASAPPPPSTPRRSAPNGDNDMTKERRIAPSAPAPDGSAHASEPTREIPRPVAPDSAAPPPPPPAPSPQAQPSPKREAKNLFGGETEAPKSAKLAQPAPVGSPSPTLTDDERSALPAAEAALPTEDVRFSAFYPKEANIEQWYTLLVYAHLDSALVQVQADAAKYKDEMGGVPRQAQSGAPAHIARGTEITLLPECEGVEFNPARLTFKWVEDMHRNEFRLRATKALAGLAGNGTITVFVGPVIIATIKFGMLFSEAEAAPVPEAPPVAAIAQMYKAEQIFISYSHIDSAVAIACRNAYKAIGYDVLIDVESLRSGELWNDALMRLIDRADIFQLFWSQNSAQSKFCREEWEYALGLIKAKGGGFIRPVYWQKPLVQPPDDLESLHFAYVPLSPEAPTP